MDCIGILPLTQEISNLKDIVLTLQPQNGAEWKKVCIEMHKKDSRRRPCDYRSKYVVSYIDISMKYQKYKERNLLASNRPRRRYFQCSRTDTLPSTLLKPWGKFKSRLSLKSSIDFLIESIES
jgi:hypothetical protein